MIVQHKYAGNCQLINLLNLVRLIILKKNYIAFNFTSANTINLDCQQKILTGLVWQKQSADYKTKYKNAKSSNVGDQRTFILQRLGNQKVYYKFVLLINDSTDE